MGLKTITTGYTNTSKSGGEYISFKILGVRCMAFKTNYKTDDGLPKYRLCCDEEEAHKLAGDGTGAPLISQAPIVDPAPQETAQHRESWEEDVRKADGEMPF